MTEKSSIKATKSGDESQLLQDAKLFLSRRSDVEQILDSVSLIDAADGVKTKQLQQALDGLDCLRFTAWCIGQEEELKTKLKEVGLSEDSQVEILKFSKKYSSLGELLVRLSRVDQGYENEFTRVVSRPLLYLKSGSMCIYLELYSHDQILIRSNQSLGGLMGTIGSLMTAARRAIEDANKLDPKLMRANLEDFDIKKFIDRMDKLREATVSLEVTDESPAE